MKTISNILRNKQHNMHTIAAIFSVLISTLIFSSCNIPLNNIDYIKNGVSADDYSIKVGDALDNYQYFVKTEWKEGSTKQGREVVEFNGYYYEKNIIVRIRYTILPQKDAQGCDFETSFVGYKFLNQPDEASVSVVSIIEDIYNNREIPRFSYIEEPENINPTSNSSNNIILNNFPADFVKFINEFTTSPKFQIDNIEFPLQNGESDIPAPTKNEWKFLDKSAIFEGLLKLSDGSSIQGKFSLEDNTISYILGYPESSLIYGLGFKKVRGNWKLVEFINEDMTAF